MRGVGTEILITWLMGHASIEVLSRHATANGALATKRKWCRHDEDIIRKRQQIFHAVEKGHLDNRKPWLSPRTTRARKDGGKTFANGGHLDCLKARGVLRCGKRPRRQFSSIQLASVPIDQIIAKLCRNNLENRASCLKNLARDLVEVAEPGTAIMQQAGNG